MKCMACGSTAMKTKKEKFVYDASGLRVTLVSVDVTRCGHCGEFEVHIPAIEQLHRVIAFAVIQQKSRLAPAEITFLRKYLGWSKAELARHMGTNAATVGRWEDGQAMGKIADRLLRLLVANREPDCTYPEDRLVDVATEKPTEKRRQVSYRNDVWQPAAA